MSFLHSVTPKSFLLLLSHWLKYQLKCLPTSPSALFKLDFDHGRFFCENRHVLVLAHWGHYKGPFFLRCRKNDNLWINNKINYLYFHIFVIYKIMCPQLLLTRQYRESFFSFLRSGTQALETVYLSIQTEWKLTLIDTNWIAPYCQWWWFVAQIVEKLVYHANMPQVSRACVHRRPFNIQLSNFITQNSSLPIAQCKPDTVHSQNPKLSHTGQPSVKWSASSPWTNVILVYFKHDNVINSFCPPTVKDTKPQQEWKRIGKEKKKPLF